MMRKGVAPVVAIVLLIAIAVIAAVAVWYWVGPLTGKPATADTTQKSISVEKCYADTDILLIRNSGTLSLTTSTSFDVYNKNTGVTVSGCTDDFDVTLNPGNVTSIAGSGCDLVAGTAYFLRATGIPDAPFTC